MAIIISTSKIKRQFNENRVITIGGTPDNDIVLQGVTQIVVSYNSADNTYSVVNANKNILFRGKPFKNLVVTKISRLLFSNSEEFINFEVLPKPARTVTEIGKQDFDESDIKNLYADDDHAVTRVKLDKVKENIDERRIAIIKDVAHVINDLKSKISQNTKGAVFSHIALTLGCLTCAFGVTNYIVGLSIQESADYLHLPTELKLWLLYTVLILGVMLIFKQGIYGFFGSNIPNNKTKISKPVYTTLIALSSVVMLGVYAFNLVYYLNYNKTLVSPILLSLFFVGITVCLGIASAYYKNNGSILSEILDKYEYREDFEKVMHDYNIWVGHFVNNLSESKLQYVSDRIFKLHIKEAFETVIGVLTAPFLAYGVSNTLANCFSEAAGWVRVASGLKFSPIFLTLATCLIVFAFFLFVNAFSIQRKISNSDIIKHDGFSNYLLHCAEILGLQATLKAKKEMFFAFSVGLAIILIEFTMNISYFTVEIGQDFSGLFLSFVAALVPTALLIAETYLLAKTKFELYALDEINARVDK